jgi:hypothetical protein
VPQSVEEVAIGAKPWTLIDQLAILDRMIDGRLDAEHLLREGSDDVGGDPRRAEAAVMSEGLRSSGRVFSRAAALRR